MGVLVIPEGKTTLFRIAIFVGLVSVVTTIIYLTPVPAQYPQSCARECHELDWPMICRVKLVLERYQTLGSACRNCPSNVTACYHENCITVDGHPDGILTANRQFPGPVIQVCQHDIIVVDIVNRIPGRSFGVHWRGQPQVETPYMDGVPMITQCPIPSLTTFQYKFRVTESGSHMWQEPIEIPDLPESYSNPNPEVNDTYNDAFFSTENLGDEILDTLFGALIVRKPNSKEIHKKYYDKDDVATVVVVHPWTPRRTSVLIEDASEAKLLINGKTQENDMPPSVFTVFPGQRHRFRVFYGGGAKNCRVILNVNKHQLLVIALDGHPIQPETVTSIELFPGSTSSGERVDFVLMANQKAGSYRLRATPAGTCTAIVSTFAVIKYEGAATEDFADETSSTQHRSVELKTYYDEVCESVKKSNFGYCLQSIRASEKISEELAIPTPDTKFYFFYDSVVASKQDGLVVAFDGGSEEVVKVPQANNLTMMLPSSPLLSQGQQISSDNICRNGSVPERCKSYDVCECVHVVNIPLNVVVELVLINKDKNDHVFHLHGYSFRVMGASKLPSNLKVNEIKSLDEDKKLVKRNFDFPVIKDTVAVVSNSVAVLRFFADNPGYWMLDEEQSSLWLKGMSVILHVGKKSDLAPIPKNFPRCGDWIGPEFFLA